MLRKPTSLASFVSVWVQVPTVLGCMRGKNNQEDMSLQEFIIYWGRQGYHTSDNKLLIKC